MPSQLIFLPGVSGNTRFWQPVADLLTGPVRKLHLGYPGFGPTPPDPRVHGIDDLVARLLEQIDQPTALIAQSMGGILAVRAALAKPRFVTHLVLAATSGGVDVGALGGRDWRPTFAAKNPSYPAWFANDRSEFTPWLPTLDQPTLLVWGDADPISPVTVGHHLASLLPRSTLRILAGGDHDVANTHADDVAPLITMHLDTMP